METLGKLFFGTKQVPEVNNRSKTQEIQTEAKSIGAFGAFFKENANSLITTSLIYYVLFAGPLRLSDRQLLIAVPTAAIWTVFQLSNFVLPALGGATVAAVIGAYLLRNATPAATSPAPQTNAQVIAQAATQIATNTFSTQPETGQSLTQTAVSAATKIATNTLSAQTGAEQSLTQTAVSAATQIATNTLASKTTPPENKQDETIKVSEGDWKKFKNLMKEKGGNLTDPAARKNFFALCKSQGLLWAPTLYNKCQAQGSTFWENFTSYGSTAIQVTVVAAGVVAIGLAGKKAFQWATTQSPEKEKEKEKEQKPAKTILAKQIQEGKQLGMTTTIPEIDTQFNSQMNERILPTAKEKFDRTETQPTPRRRPKKGNAEIPLTQEQKEVAQKVFERIKKKAEKETPASGNANKSFSLNPGKRVTFVNTKDEGFTQASKPYSV